MWKFKISYDGRVLGDSEELGYTYETEDEVWEEAEIAEEACMDVWEIEGNDYDEDLFDIEVMEV